MTEFFEPDGPGDHRLALSEPPGRLRDLNIAGVLTAADLQLARRVSQLAGSATGREEAPDAVLALALCARALRTGSVCADLAAPPELPDGAAMSWPDPTAWAAAIDRSALVASGVVHRTGTLVHLDRYHREEVQVAVDLLARSAQSVPGVDLGRLEDGLARIFPRAEESEQQAAARHALTRRTTVLTGGPGTGKTTTVAGILALLREENAGTPLRVALAAPTGKAAARLAEAIAEADERRRAAGTEPRSAEPLAAPNATTLHRLLGWIPQSSIRFRHHRGHPLPYEVVVVDEASMLSLTMTARLLEAVRPDARLILVGDPDQLASVEAGAVLADLVHGFADRGEDSPVVSLHRSHRFGGRIGALAEALRAVGESPVRDAVIGSDPATPVDPADAVVAVARGQGATTPTHDAATPSKAGGRVEFVALDLDSSQVATAATERQLEEALRAYVLPHARRLREVATSGSVEDALEVLAAHRLLCAHRSGPRGVATQNHRIETWLAETDPGVVPGGSYAGRPLLVVRNDPQLGLYNGDTGIVVPGDDGVLRAVFATSGERRTLAVSRLGDVETMHAMTIHKAQGSQAGRITVVLPEADSQLLTRELLYTAVTRAENEVRLIGSEPALRAAVARHVQRASGLAQRLGVADTSG